MKLAPVPAQRKYTNLLKEAATVKASARNQNRGETTHTYDLAENLGGSPTHPPQPTSVRESGSLNTYDISAFNDKPLTGE